MTPKKVAIIGSGLIGRSWAMLFAAADYKVVLFDIQASLVDAALENISQQLDQLEGLGLLKGKLSKTDQLKNITGSQDLGACMQDAVYVQECVPDDLDKKKAVFAELDKLVLSSDVILASSSSYKPISVFTSDLKNRQQCIVSHPVNPPFYCPMVEVVPAPYTDESITKRTVAILKELELVPVLLKKEKLGFILNRLQCAILSESLRLLDEEVADADAIDTVMSEGLGMRYAFLGPLEVAHLNSPQGLEEYAVRYGPSIEELAAEMSRVPSWQGPGLQRAAQQLQTRTPPDELQKRRQWRDNCLAGLAKLKRDYKQ